MRKKQKSDENEVLPPLLDKKGDVYVDILAQYTERPDLFLEAIEKHDPGFIKKMNENSVEFANTLRVSKFKFGERQAYSSLILSVISGISILGLSGFVIYEGQSGFWIFLALALFYAITQGGLTGFKKIIEAISDLIKTFKKPNA